MVRINWKLIVANVTALLINGILVLVTTLQKYPLIPPIILCVLVIVVCVWFSFYINRHDIKKVG